MVVRTARKMVVQMVPQMDVQMVLRSVALLADHLESLTVIRKAVQWETQLADTTAS